MIEAEAFRTFIRVYSLFKSERLSTIIKLILQKLERLRNKALRTIGNLPRRTPVREMHMAFHLAYVYDCMTKHAGSKQKSF
jgi:hypothetical protein